MLSENDMKNSNKSLENMNFAFIFKSMVQESSDLLVRLTASQLNNDEFKL